MADKVRFLISSVLDSATITASSDTAGLPHDNVANTLIRKVYRTQGIENEWIQWEAAAATGIDFFWMGGHTLSKNATVLFQGNTTSTWSSGPALSTSISIATDAQGNVVPKAALFYNSGNDPDPKTFKFWRLYVEDSLNASVSFEIGRVMAGRYIEPVRNNREGFSFTTMDPSRSSARASRQGYATTRTQYLEISYEQFDMDEVHADEILGMYGSVGSHTAFVLAIDPDTRPHHNTIYAQFPQRVSTPNRIVRQRNLQTVMFSEKI